MLKRVLTGVTLSAIALGLIYVQGWLLRIVLLALLIIGMFEVYSAFEKKEYKPVKWTGILFCALISAAIFSNSGAYMHTSAVEMVAIALITCFILATTAVIMRGKPDLDSLMASVLPMLYPGMFFAVFMAIQNLPGAGISRLAFVLSIFVASMNDCFALFAGLWFGTKKLAPEISPKKTIAGCYGGLTAATIFSVLFAWLFTLIMPETHIPPLWAFAPLGLLAGALSQLGDLTASLIKRYCGVKDFGRIFPGHGGVMDRLDGILFSAIGYYIFFALTIGI